MWHEQETHDLTYSHTYDHRSYTRLYNLYTKLHGRNVTSNKLKPIIANN